MPVDLRGDGTPQVLFAVVVTTSSSLGIDVEALGAPAAEHAPARVTTDARLTSAHSAWISALDRLSAPTVGATDLDARTASVLYPESTSGLSSATLTVASPEIRSGRGVQTVTVTRANNVVGAGAVTVTGGGRAAINRGAITRKEAGTTTARTAVTSLHGIALLQRLGVLDSNNLSTTLAQHPKLVAGLIAAPPSAIETSNTWASMSPANRSSLEHAAPRLVGALEGVPYAVRNTANRVYLAQSIRSASAQLASGVGREQAAALQTRLHMLQQVKLAITPTKDGLPRELISFDPVGEGRAVISVGNLSSAKYVSYLVPGMFYGVDARVVPWTATAGLIADEQTSWLKKLGTTTSQRDQGVAVVSWIGYQTPTLANVAAMADARVGSAALASSLDGLTVTRATSTPYVTVLAHSYGATAALLALQQDDVHVNALAMVGSPGSPATSVKQLGVDGTVWVGAAPWDPIPESGVFGSQPTSSSYGAKSMGVSGGTDQITSKRLLGAVSHNDYFTPNGETLRNFALIGIDKGSYVMAPDGSSVALGSTGVRAAG